MAQEYYPTFDPDDEVQVTMTEVIEKNDEAIRTKFSGTAEPTSNVVPYQSWMDTTNNILKMRNGSSTAWIDIYDTAAETPFIAAGAVDTTELADASVTEAKIDTGAVTETKIGDLAVTNGKLADASVSNAKISNYTVTSGKLALNAVIESRIEDGAVTAVKINDTTRKPSIINSEAITPATCSLKTTYKLGGNGFNICTELFSLVSGLGTVAGGGSFNNILTSRMYITTEITSVVMMAYQTACDTQFIVNGTITSTTSTNPGAAWGSEMTADVSSLDSGWYSVVLRASSTAGGSIGAVNTRMEE